MGVSFPVKFRSKFRSRCRGSFREALRGASRASRACARELFEDLGVVRKRAQIFASRGWSAGPLVRMLGESAKRSRVLSKPAQRGEGKGR